MTLKLTFMGFLLLSACQPLSEKREGEGTMLSFEFEKDIPVAGVGYEGPIQMDGDCAYVELETETYALAFPQSDTQIDEAGVISVAGMRVLPDVEYSASIVVTDTVSDRCNGRKIIQLIPPLYEK